MPKTLSLTGKKTQAPKCSPKPCSEPPVVSDASYEVQNEQAGLTYGNTIKYVYLLNFINR